MKRNLPLIILFLNKASIFTFTVHNIRAEAQGKQACSRQTLAVVVGSFEKKRTFTAKASTEFIIQIDWRPHCPLTKAGGLSVQNRLAIHLMKRYVNYFPGETFPTFTRSSYYVLYYYSYRAIGIS